MKTVLMKSSFAGQVNWPAGSIQELEDEEAIRLVENGFAEYADGAPDAEKRNTRIDKRAKRR